MLIKPTVGTEEIVKNLIPNETNLPLPPSWPPQTISSYFPWLNEEDGENVLFSSVHLFQGKEFYPCSGSGEEREDEEFSNIINIPLTPLGPSDITGRLKLSHVRVIVKNMTILGFIYLM